MAKRKPYLGLEKMRTAPESLTKLQLNPMGLYHQGYDCPVLDEFPRELFACKNLRTLEIFRGLDQRRTFVIPKEIGNLTKLEELTLGGIAYKKLPDTLGNLKRLRTLSLSYAAVLDSLPATIGKLTALESLEAAASGLRDLPPGIGKLTKLKELSLAGSKLQTIPKELFAARSLEKLTLPASVTKLPPGLGRLDKLVYLGLSASALASAAAELPKLTKLRCLSVDGKATALPDELGSLRSLKELEIGYLGLKSLPATLSGLTSLEELEVDGNELRELASQIAELPRLRRLSFSDNPLPLEEKRRVQALLRVPPAKRAAAMKKKDATTRASSAKAPSDLERLGDVSAVNATLVMLVADARVAMQYKGTRNGASRSDSTGSDWDRLTDAIGSKDFAPFALHGKSALALSLGVGAGIASLWSTGGRLVVFEGIFEGDEDDLDEGDRLLLREHLASPPKRAKKIASIDVKSGQLVIAPSTAPCDDVARLLERKTKGPAVKCGANGDGRMVAVKPGRLDVLLEAEVEAAWGSGRRCFFVPS